MIPEYKPRAEYIGAGNLADYTFDFKITNVNQVIVQVIDDDLLPVYRVRGVDGTRVLGIVFNQFTQGGTVTLNGFLPAGYFLTILLAPDTPVQLSQFKNKDDFTLRRLEAALDYQMSVTQRLTYLVSRAVKLSDSLRDTTPFDPTIPVVTTDPLVSDSVGKTIIIGDDNASLKLGPSYGDIVESLTDAIRAIVAELMAEAGAGVPAGGLAYAVLEKLSATEGDADWSVPISLHGISARFGNTQFDGDGVFDVLSKIVQITYTPPALSLSSPQSALREVGDSISAITLTASYTRRSNDIATVRFYVGATLLDTQAAGPLSGSKNYVYAPAFQDTITFNAQVDDIAVGGNGPSTTPASLTFQFVRPYFWGSGAVGNLTAANIALKTKDIRASQDNITRNFTVAGGNYFYFAQPASYPLITKIYDVNNFEVQGGFNSFTGNYTALDGSSQSLRVYVNTAPINVDTPLRYVR